MKTLLKIALTTVLSLILLEAGLRSFGFAHHYRQIHRHGHEAGKKPTVLALGESTTAESASGSWPDSLQALLENAKIPAQVINEGVPGTMTTLIVSRLPELLEKYQPVVVITMMGINDQSGLVLNRRGLIATGSFVSDLRVFKLLKLLRGLVFKDRAYFEELAVQPLPIPKEVEMALEGKKFQVAEKQVGRYLAGKSESEKAGFYSAFFTSVTLKNYYPNDAEALASSFRVLSASLPFAHKYHYLAGILMSLAKVERQPDICRQVLDQYMNGEIKPDSFALNMASGCLDARDPVLTRFLSEFAPDLETAQDGAVPTKENYQQFYRLLKSRGICWIVMQYPRFDLEQVLGRFTPEQKNDPLLRFVSNQENFEEALLTHSTAEVFSDLFAWKFGHTTSFGHQLIAQRALPEVAKALQDPLCQNER